MPGTAITGMFLKYLLVWDYNNGDGLKKFWFKNILK
jgi:hypothetical protein